MKIPSFVRFARPLIALAALALPVQAAAQAPAAPPAPRFKDIYTGMQGSCGVEASGQVHCWGIAQTVGDGTDTTRANPSAMRQPTGVRFTQISIGNATACGVTPEGAAYCWGQGSYGQIGDGGIHAKRVPTPVRMPAGVTFKQVAVGGDHSCGLASDGKVFCWGAEGFGIPYPANAAHALTPIPIEAGELRFTQISAAEEYTCGLTAQGRVHCWGNNARAMLMDGTNNPSRVPVATKMADGLAFTQLAVSSGHNCALTASGEAYCWGWNRFGELGTNDVRERDHPVAVTVPEGVRFRSIGVGDRHTCGLTAEGQAYCWGDNTNGTVGGGTRDPYKLLPTRVMQPAGVTFSKLAVSPRHVCAITEAGATYCWGDGSTGEIGDGHRVPRFQPVEVTARIPNVVRVRPPAGLVPPRPR